MPGKTDRQTAFGEIVHANAGSVLSLALRITGDADAAQDASQDVFASAWRVFGNGEAVANWPAYLRTATVRRALRHLKGRKAAAGEQLDAVADPSPSPGRTAEYHELESRVRDCLLRLTEKQALAFALVKLDGLPYRECAEVLSCSENSARVHAHRAMTAIAKMLHAYAPTVPRQQSDSSVKEEEE